MTNEELDQIRKIFDEVLSERRSIDSKTHQADHQFLHRLMEKESRKEELIEATKKQVLGWATVLVIGFIGYSILDYIKNFLIKIIH